MGAISPRLWRPVKAILRPGLERRARHPETTVPPASRTCRRRGRSGQHACTRDDRHTARAIPHRRTPRPGRDGCGLSGDRRDARPSGGDQGPARRRPLRGHRHGAVPQRSPDPLAPRSPAHSQAVRLLRARWRALHGHRVRERGGPAAVARTACGGGRAASRRMGVAGARRARLRAPARRGAPRHQARQHPHRRAQSRAVARFRHRAHRRHGRPDQDRTGRRHAHVHGAGAGARRAHRRPGRRLRVRGGAVPDARRTPAASRHDNGGPAQGNHRGPDSRRGRDAAPAGCPVRTAARAGARAPSRRAHAQRRADAPGTAPGRRRSCVATAVARGATSRRTGCRRPGSRRVVGVGRRALVHGTGLHDGPDIDNAGGCDDPRAAAHPAARPRRLHARPVRSRNRRPARSPATNSSSTCSCTT